MTTGKWELVDMNGYLQLNCDGVRVCDFFPHAKGADPDWVTIQAGRILERMQGSRLLAAVVSHQPQ